jgi:hypothetical protein
VTAALSGLPNRMPVRIDLLIGSPQVPQCPLQRVSGCELHPRAEDGLTVTVQRMRDLTTAREAHDDLGGLSHLLNRHLLEIAERILRVAETTYSTTITQHEVVWAHPAVASPTDQAGDDPVLAPLFQHKGSLYKVRLWMAKKRRMAGLRSYMDSVECSDDDRDGDHDRKQKNQDRQPRYVALFGHWTLF